jgi:nitrogen regulatory protein P-II 1
MKVIVAVIKPFKVDELTEALHAVGISGITLTEVRGHGRQRGHTEVYRGAEYRVEYLPKVRIEVVADDDDVDAIVTAIVESSRTGKIGDGKYWVIPVETVGRIRTGEVGPDAL